ncbi:hypothetical protein ACXJJ3_26730 [Kribbella sp. WER1]
MARKLGVDGQAVAYAVLEGLMNERGTLPMWESQDSNGIAHHLLEAADVEYQPRARKLILTFDLSEPDDPWAGAGNEPVAYTPVPQLDHSAAENAAAAAEAGEDAP